MTLYDSKGNLVQLGSRLGRGGEGDVFEIQGHNDLVAKIYHNPVAQEKAVKLSTMVNLQTERLLSLAAWPIDTLHGTSGGKVVGFLMRKISDYKEIHDLYNPKSRLAEFPNASWTFLIHAATNVARAFSVAHKDGHIIADVNHGNILVSKKATVVLIDCDSFQVTAKEQRYLCDVGISTHTPPELQGQSFRGIVRTANHDAFGLAVIIFQLLFMGRHPFAGAYIGTGEMSLENHIKEFRFAYGSGALSRQMRQPPGTLSLEAVSQPVAQLFERAFLREDVRPSSQEWIPALTELSKNLKQCSHNNGHHFLNALPSCPWCNIEAQAGIVLFIVTGILHAQGTFNLTSVWAQIEAIHLPEPLSALPEKTSLKISASSKAVHFQRIHLLWLSLSICLVVLGTIIVLFSNLSGGVAFWLILGITVLSINIAKVSDSPVRKEIENAKQEAEKQWQVIHQRWEKDAGIGRLIAKFRELESKKLEYQNLPSLKLQKIKHLEVTLRERQLYKFLDRFRIIDAGIRGIGSSRTATLQSYGIETAADVDWNTILRIPGFGPAYTEEIVDWRLSIEKKFVFNPSQGVDPADLQAMEQEIAATRAQIETEIRNGPAQLHRINYQIKTAREVLRPVVEDALKALVQAETDWKKVSKKSSSVVFVFIALGIALILVFSFKHRIEESKIYKSITKNPPVNKVAPVPPPSQSQNKNEPSPPSVEQEIAQAQAFYEQGVAFTKASQHEQALQAYQQAIALKPDLAEAHHELGYAFYKLRKYENAITSFSQAIKLKPKRADTYHNLGLVYIALTHWEDAAEVLEQAIEIKPDYTVAYYNLGLVYKNLTNNEAAIEVFQEAVRLKPNYAVAHYELALAYLAIGNQDAAIKEYQILSSLNEKLANKLYRAIVRW
jgi:DNA-binding helix-hairpin-helix protein with protein kinase domain/Flp pilus assembly protein TadD